MLAGEYNSSYYNNGQHYFRGLKSSYVGGKEAKDGYNDPIPWYYYANYDPFPFLRMFMDWKTVLVKTDNTTVSSIIGTTPIEIPKNMQVSISDPSAIQFFLGGNSFSISIKDAHKDNYLFEGWEISGNTITAKIKALFGYIVFKAAANSDHTEDQTYMLKDTEIVSFVIDQNKSSVTFTFNDSNGDPQTVKYTASKDIYYCKSAGITSSHTVVAGNSKDIMPIFELKRYNVTFG